MLLNGGAEINVINQRFAVIAKFLFIKSKLFTSQFMNDNENYCYGAYKVNFILKNNWEKIRIFDAVYYAIDKKKPELILNLSELKKKIIIDYDKINWRYDFDKSFINLNTIKRFSRAIKKNVSIYAVIIITFVASLHEKFKTNVNAMMGPKNDFNAQAILSDEYSEFENFFSNEKAFRLINRKDCDHVIDLKRKDPFYESLYNLSNTELKILRKYLDTALAKGWIRHSISPAGAPVLFAPKKNGQLRLCVDYRGLNKITRKNRHLLFFIIQILNNWQIVNTLSNWISKIIIIKFVSAKKNEWKTVFRTSYEHFEYLVMFFDLINVSPTFQTYVNKILFGLVDDFCVIYLNDILIFFKNRKSHVKHVKQMLHKLRKYELYVNLKKCEFFLKKVKYLNFIISENGIEMNSRRVKIIKIWPELKSFKNIQVFLGFANFYRRFIYKYSQIIKPLTNMLKDMKTEVKKGPFNPTVDVLAAFDKFKKIFQTAFILVHFNPELFIRLKTDTSEFGIAGIISQLQVNGQWHFVAFYSRKMIFAKRNYEIHDQKLLIIVMCFKQLKHYFESNVHFIEVLTDHNNLKNFMNVKILSGKQVKWAMKIVVYDFIIKHRVEKINFANAPFKRFDYKNVNTKITKLLSIFQKKLSMIDAIEQMTSHKMRVVCAAMSDNLRSKIVSSENEILKNSENEIFESISTIEHNQRKNDMKHVLPRVVVVKIVKNEDFLKNVSKSVLNFIKALQQKNEFVRNRFKKMSEAGSIRSRVSNVSWIKNRKGFLKHRGKYYVFNKKFLKAELFRFYYDDKLIDHYEFDKTLKLLKRKFYWKNMIKYVKKYVKSCDICQKVKILKHKSYGVIMSLPQSCKFWKKIIMDFVSDFSSNKRFGVVYNSCLVIVDKYIKMILYLSISKIIKTIVLIELIFEKIILKFGDFNEIVSNKESMFINDYWSEICYYLQVKRRLNIAFHSQTNGQTKRQNQILENYFKIFVTDNQVNWVALLPFTKFVHNFSAHSITGLSPFKTLYGYEPEIRFEVEDDIDREKVSAVKERIKGLHDLRSELAQRWLKASETQAKSYNKKHQPKDFNTGEWVLLSAKNLKQKRPNKKLSHKFLGPFKILEPVGKQAYRLTLPPTYKN